MADVAIAFAYPLVVVDTDVVIDIETTTAILSSMGTVQADLVIVFSSVLVAVMLP